MSCWVIPLPRHTDGGLDGRRTAGLGSKSAARKRGPDTLTESPPPRTRSAVCTRGPCVDNAPSPVADRQGVCSQEGSRACRGADGRGLRRPHAHPTGAGGSGVLCSRQRPLPTRLLPLMAAWHPGPRPAGPGAEPESESHSPPLLCGHGASSVLTPTRESVSPGGASSTPGPAPLGRWLALVCIRSPRLSGCRSSGTPGPFTPASAGTRWGERARQRVGGALPAAGDARRAASPGLLAAVRSSTGNRPHAACTHAGLRFSGLRSGRAGRGPSAHSAQPRPRAATSPVSPPTQACPGP